MLTDYPELKAAASKSLDETKPPQETGEARPVKEVQVDGLALLKMIQHAHEYVPEQVSGQCMGLYNGDALEITHTYPLLSKKEFDETEVEAKAEEEYQEKIQGSLRQFNVDCNVVGLYVISWQESHYCSAVVENLKLYQEELGEGAVCLLFDPLKSQLGKLYLKALRLKPAFMRMLVENQDKKDFSQHVINNAQVTSADIFQEVPITINNGCLADQFLWELGCSEDYSVGTSESNIVAKNMAVSAYQNISALTLVDCTENLLQELTRYQNATRRSRQQEDDRQMVGRPSRLETLYASAQLNNLAKHICDVTQMNFESVSLSDAIQQAQSQPAL